MAGAGERGERRRLAGTILKQHVRRHSTAIVLCHQAVAGRLGLGPADHKCLDLLRERGAMSGSGLAALTGLTSGAITGVVARLERAGYLRREADPLDGRRQILTPVVERMAGLHAVLAPIRQEVAALLAGFDAHQLAAIAGFLDGSAAIAHRQAAVLRADTRGGAARPGSPPAPGRRARRARP